MEGVPEAQREGEGGAVEDPVALEVVLPLGDLLSVPLVLGEREEEMEEEKVPGSTVCDTVPLIAPLALLLPPPNPEGVALIREMDASRDTVEVALTLVVALALRPVKEGQVEEEGVWVPPPLREALPA